MEQEKNILTKCGTIIFLDANQGSKSEGLYPYLYESAGVCTRVMLENDNPFENKGLLPFDGVKVTLLCREGRRNCLIVTSVSEVLPAAAAETEKSEESENI